MPREAFPAHSTDRPVAFMTCESLSNTRIRGETQS